MDDALRYAGKRVIVAGAASETGEATARILVDLGAEVHAVDAEVPTLGGLASTTICDWRDPHLVDAAVTRIGSVVNGLFVCAGETGPDGAGIARLIEAVVPHTIEGSAIAWVAPDSVDSAFGGAGPEPTTVSAGRGVRVNCVDRSSSESTVPAGDVAWILVWLNSPRAAGLTGQRIVGVGPGGASVRPADGALTPEAIG